MLAKLMILVACAGLVAPSVGWSQTTQPSDADADEDVVYRPPTQGASRARMGGGSRTGVKLPVIEALVPDHAGFTISGAPVLYWYCDEPTQLPCEFSLVDANTLDTVKRVRVPTPASAGWQKIDLSDLGVELAPDTPYEWRVAIIAGTGKASDNAVAGGLIERVSKPQIADALVQPALRKAATLAAAGVWYDALATIMREVETDPSNVPARKALTGLLEQVNLKASAGFSQRS